LKGQLHRDDSAGQYDLYIELTMRFGWTPEQVNSLDIEFLAELLQRIQAESKYQAEEHKKLEKKSASGRKGR